jgi:hypothetical protein
MNGMPIGNADLEDAMLTIKRNKDNTITITFRLFCWRWALWFKSNYHYLDFEWWKVAK